MERNSKLIRFDGYPTESDFGEWPMTHENWVKRKEKNRKTGKRRKRPNKHQPTASMCVSIDSLWWMRDRIRPSIKVRRPKKPASVGQKRRPARWLQCHHQPLGPFFLSHHVCVCLSVCVCVCVCVRVCHHSGGFLGRPSVAASIFGYSPFGEGRKEEWPKRGGLNTHILTHTHTYSHTHTQEEKNSRQPTGFSSWRRLAGGGANSLSISHLFPPSWEQDIFLIFLLLILLLFLLLLLSLFLILFSSIAFFSLPS